MGTHRQHHLIGMFAMLQLLLLVLLQASLQKHFLIEMETYAGEKPKPGESEDYAIPGALTALLSFFGTKAAKEAALAGAKEICKATGGMDYADYAQSWGDWAEEHLASAGRFTKKLAI